MKKMIIGAALLAALPLTAQAQSLQPGGVYVGLEGGLNWMFNSSFTSTLTVAPVFSASTTSRTSYNTGFVLGGVVGYDFIGPRVELEGAYRENAGTLTVGGFSGNAGVQFNQANLMGNLYYDFFAGQSF